MVVQLVRAITDGCLIHLQGLSKLSIVSIVRVRRTRTRRTGYAHPRTWNLAGRLVGAASKMVANAT